MANAMTLYFRALMPSESAATSSSRIAVQDRPDPGVLEGAERHHEDDGTPRIR